MWRTLPSEKLITLLPPFLDSRALSRVTAPVAAVPDPACENTVCARFTSRRICAFRASAFSNLRSSRTQRRNSTEILLGVAPSSGASKIGLDGALMAVKRWPITDIRDRRPFARGAHIARARHIHTVLGQHLRLGVEIQSRYGLLRSPAFARHHCAAQCIRPAQQRHAVETSPASIDRRISLLDITRLRQTTGG